MSRSDSPRRRRLEIARGLAPAATISALRPRPALAYILFAIACFLLALAYSMPHDLIASRIIASALAREPVRVAFEDVSFAFPNGYRFRGLEVSPSALAGRSATIDELTIRISLLGWLLGRPRGATFSGRAFDGTLAGRVEQRGAGAALVLDAADLDLGRLSADLLPPPAKVAGRALLELELAGDGRTLRTATGSASFRVRDLELARITASGVLLPDLTLSSVSAEAQLAGARLQVREARASGSGVAATATGEVLLRDPVPQSTLSARFHLEVGAEAAPPLRILSGLLPKRGSADTGDYTLAGTLESPTIR